MLLVDGLFKGGYFLCEGQDGDRILSMLHTVNDLRKHAGKIEKLVGAARKRDLFNHLQEKLEKKRDMDRNYGIKELSKMFGADLVNIDGMLFHEKGATVSLLRSFLSAKGLDTQGLTKTPLFKLLQSLSNDEGYIEEESEKESASETEDGQIHSPKSKWQPEERSPTREHMLKFIFAQGICNLENGKTAKEAAKEAMMSLVDFMF